MYQVNAKIVMDTDTLIKELSKFKVLVDMGVVLYEDRIQLFSRAPPFIHLLDCDIHKMIWNRGKELLPIVIETTSRNISDLLDTIIKKYSKTVVIKVLVEGKKVTLTFVAKPSNITVSIDAKIVEGDILAILAQTEQIVARLKLPEKREYKTILRNSVIEIHDNKITAINHHKECRIQLYPIFSNTSLKEIGWLNDTLDLILEHIYLIKGTRYLDIYPSYGIIPSEGMTVIAEPLFKDW